jgi:hypothetical protein
MPDLPPMAEVLDALKKAVAPSAGAAAFVFSIGLAVSWLVSQFARFEWRSVPPPFAVLSLAAGLAVGNHFRDVFHFRFLPESDGKWWHWVWPAVAALLAAELIARLPRVNPGLGYIARLIGFAVGPCYLIPQAWAPEGQWCLWWIPALIAMWAILTEVGDLAPGGSLSAAIAVVAAGAAAVLLHSIAHGLTDIATFVGCALMVMAVLAFLTQTDASSAASVGAVIVAVLLLVSQSTAVKVLPREIYYLVAFAPFALGATLLPGFNRINDLRYAPVLKVALVAIPVVIGVVWTMRVAPLQFGAEEW